MLTADLERMSPSKQGEAGATLPDLVRDDFTCGTTNGIVAHRNVDQWIGEDFFLVHLDAGLAEIFGAGNGLLRDAAPTVGMIKAKAGFKCCARTENMSPASTVVRDVELAHLSNVRVEVWVPQICVLLAVAKVKRVARGQIVVPTDVE